MRFRLTVLNGICLPFFFSLLSWHIALAQNAPDDFANKSIEELMNIDVTSVSRKEQKLSQTPAAVYVITREAIARSGANTIPDLLRMVPGVQVAQVEANRWAISVRGFNGVYSNKLLVLVDGRTVYTPTFSGVYWNQIDIPLDTIERIEVVRGPGGAVWGANAVNGVINIITEDSANTQGTRISAGAGSFQTGGYEARFGGKLGHVGTYRAFGDFSSFGSLPIAPGQSGHDGWQIGHGGFRADLSRSSKDTFMLEGNLFRTDGGQTIAPEESTSFGTVEHPLTDYGFDVLGRWTHTHSDTSQSSLQIYHSEYSRFDAGLAEGVHALDLDFQNHTRIGSRNDLVWGLGYRFNGDHLTEDPSSANTLNRIVGFSVGLTPPSKSYNLLSGFFQDEISLKENFALTVGTKIEHNAFSGFEYEPSIRLAWTPNSDSILWMAASKAVRQPSRLDTALNLQLPVLYLGSNLGIAPHIIGNPSFQAEAVHDYELGYRMTPHARISFDLSTFYSFYRALENSLIRNPVVTDKPGLRVVNIPIVSGNGLKAQNYGGEAGATWNVASRWKLSSSYSFLQTSSYLEGNSTADPGAALTPVLPAPIAESLARLITSTALGQELLGTTPRHQFNAQSYLNLSSKISFDSSAFFVGRLEGTGIPAYTRVDAHLAYKLRKGWELSLTGQNLLNPRHVEFANAAAQAVSTQVERSVFGKVVWTF